MEIIEERIEVIPSGDEREFMPYTRYECPRCKQRYRWRFSNILK